MRIAFIGLFLLMIEIHAEPTVEWEKDRLKKNLEQEALESGGKYSFPRFFSPYEDPKPVLNDSVFAFVQEYLEGYTGYLCSAEGNIRYTLEPCSQHVWECSDGKLLKKTCEGSSVFWFEEGTCDSTVSKESTCKWKRKHIRGSSWPPEFIHIAKVKNATELSSLAPGSSPTLITTDCRKYEFAYFEIKHCHPEYIRCSQGVRFMHTCPFNWLFDERHLNCVPKEICGAPTIPFGYFRSEPILIADTPETAEFYRNLRSPPILITIDCKKKADNHYEIGKCQPNWIECRDGARIMYSCLGGEVYKLRKDCIELKECEETWREDETTTPAPMVEEEKVEFAWSKILPDAMALVPTNSGYKMKCSDGFVLSRRYLSCVGKELCDY